MFFNSDFIIIAGMIGTAVIVSGIFAYFIYKNFFTTTHSLQGNSSLGNTLPKLEPQGSKKPNKILALIIFLFFTFMFFYFNSELVSTFFILRFFVFCVHIYALYKNLYLFMPVQIGCNVVSKEAGVQTEPLHNSTSSENVTNVESAFPELVEPSYDIADEKTYSDIVQKGEYLLNINYQEKTMFLVNKVKPEVLSVDPTIHPEYFDPAYFDINAF
jgi:hypothetical protein